MLLPSSNPNGTGEKFDGMDLSFNISYGKKLAEWFSFGVTAKIYQFSNLA